jgi:osmotically inducible lipoprotein OsmB
MTSKVIVASMLLIAGLSLQGCGYSQGDRAVSGGLIGAGSGAALGAAFGGGPGAAIGAAVGGVTGAATGALTSPEDLNLGRPVWR